VVKNSHAAYWRILLGLLVSVGSSAYSGDLAVSDDGSRAEQSRPRIAVHPGRGFLAVWEDKRGGIPDIYFQRFDLSGNPVGLNLRVTDDTAKTVYKQPAVSVDYSGRYLLGWLDYRHSAYPQAPQIYGQRIDSSGNFLGSNKRLTIEPPDSLRAAPDVTLGPSGEGLVVWEDYRNRTWDIYAQRIGANGSLIGTNFKINDDQNTTQQHSPRLAVSPDGWYIVTWYDNRWGNDDIFVQRLDSAGKKIGQNIKVNSDDGSSRQAFPDVAADGAGHFTVVWTDWRNGTYPNNPDIYARKYDTLMTALTSDTKVNRDGSTRAQKDPSVAADRMGNVGIVWSDSGATSFDILGQMIDVDGVIRETNFRANSSTDSAQVQPDIALDGRYRYVCWADNRNGNWDILASITKYNNPTLVPAPANFQFSMEIGKPIPSPKTLIISHAGYNRLQYAARSSVPWLVISPSSGWTTDTVTVSLVDSAFTVGTYSAILRLVDLTNQDSSVTVPVVLSCREPNNDTLRISSARTTVGESVGIDVTVMNADTLAGIVLPLKADSTVMRYDSVTLASGLPSGALALLEIESNSANAVVTVTFDSTAPLAPGQQTVCRLWVTGLGSGLTVVDSGGSAGVSPAFLTSSGISRSPVFQRGELLVDEATDVSENPNIGLPTEFSLAQNYPNPFNNSTVITFDLPEVGPTLLEVFNVLGQRIAVLIDRKLPVGRQQVIWNGLSDRGAVLTSGVYFYRLRSGSVSLVRKMILLK
jgi:hypothetical protein